MPSDALPGMTYGPPARREREGHGFPRVPALPDRLRSAIRIRPSAERVFRALGFTRVHRHWVYGETLFVETVPRPVAGPTEVVEIGDARFRVVKKEVPLRDRVVGFKHWEVTAYGAEAMAMIVAFAGDLDESWLFAELKREDAVDAFEALQELVKSDEEVTEKTLRDLLDRLHRRKGG